MLKDIITIFLIIGGILLFTSGMLYINNYFSATNNSDFECYHNECYKYIRLEQQTACYKGCQNALNNKELFHLYNDCINKCAEQYDYKEAWEQ